MERVSSATTSLVLQEAPYGSGSGGVLSIIVRTTHVNAAVVESDPGARVCGQE